MAGTDRYTAAYDRKKQAVVVELSQTAVTEEITITLAAKEKTVCNDVAGRCFDFLNQAEIEFVKKDLLYRMITEAKNPAVLLSELHAQKLDPDLYGALMELITA